MRQVGIMKWEEMNWLFPDFEETELLYHGADPDALDSIMSEGLVAGYSPDPDDCHETIYEAHSRPRPPEIPDWVNPAKCIFGYMNRSRQGGSHKVPGGQIVQVDLAFPATETIRERTWVCSAQFSDWVYCPQEAGYYDTVERRRFFEDVVEPVCSNAYWRTSLSFNANLKVRHDNLLINQAHIELLICVDRIAPTSLSIEGVRVKGPTRTREATSKDFAGQFANLNERLFDSTKRSEALRQIEQRMTTDVSNRQG